MQRLVENLCPGSKLGRISRLRGGLSNGVFRVSYSDAQGRWSRVVVRLTTEHRVGAAANARNEFRTISLLPVAGVPAPRLFLLDETGECLGLPGSVMEHAGRPLMTPRDRGAWLSQLAAAIVRLHAMTPDIYDLAHLPIGGPAEIHEEAAKELPENLREDVLAIAMHATLRRKLFSLVAAGPCLVHSDYWPGNTVWRRGRLSAVVDWTSAKVGDPREDVAQCRIDLAMIHGSETADEFLARYQGQAPSPLVDVSFFDLLRGISALSTFRSWLPGYHDLGLHELTEEMVEKRLRAFLAASLKAS